MVRKAKNIIKKILSTLLIFFILAWPLYNIFIHNDNIDEEKVGEEEQWKGVITLWDYPRLNVETGSRYGWINEKIKRFEKENPGVYIRLETINWQKGPLKLESGLKTGYLPDIAPVANDFIYMKEDVLESMDNHLTQKEKEEFKYQALKSVRYDEKLWGIPCMMTTYSMFLNLDLFRQRGVEPPLDGNWTYDEFIEKMKKLTYDSDSDGEIDNYGFVSFIKANYYNTWGIILNDGAEVLNEKGEYAFYGDKAVSGVKKLVDLRNKHKVTPEEFGTLNENEAWEMFYKDQNVAAYPTGTWAVRVLENLRSRGEGFEFAVANYPIGDKQIPTSLSNNVVSYGIFKQKDKGKLNMCVKFLKFIAQDKYQKELEKLGMFPVKTGIDDMYINNRKMKRLEDCLAYTQILPRHREWKDIDRILQSQIRMAVLGEKTSEEALKEANTQINQLLGR